jgi:hypothetical protein
MQYRPVDASTIPKKKKHIKLQKLLLELITNLKMKTLAKD